MEDFDLEMEKIMARLNSMEDQLRCEKHNNEHLIDAGPQLRQLQPIGVVAILCCASMFATSASRLLSHLNA